MPLCASPCAADACPVILMCNLVKQGCLQTGTRQCHSSGWWQSGGGGSACSRGGTPPPSSQSCCGRCAPPRCVQHAQSFSPDLPLCTVCLWAGQTPSARQQGAAAVGSSGGALGTDVDCRWLLCRCCGRRRRPTTSSAAKLSTCQVRPANTMLRGAFLSGFRIAQFRLQVRMREPPFILLPGDMTALRG